MWKRDEGMGRIGGLCVLREHSFSIHLTNKRSPLDYMAPFDIKTKPGHATAHYHTHAPCTRAYLSYINILNIKWKIRDGIMYSSMFLPALLS